MDTRSSLASGSSSSRFVCKDVAFSRLPLRGGTVRTPARFSSSVFSVANAGDFDSERDADDASSRPTSSPPSSDEHSRKKLEVVTGLLREGYGLGAVLTAAAIRGVSVTTDLLRGVTQSGVAAARRHRVIQHSRKSASSGARNDDLSIVEKLQRTMSESLMAAPIAFRKAHHVTQATQRSESGEGSDPQSSCRDSSLSFSNGEQEPQPSPEVRASLDETPREGEGLGEESDRGLSDLKEILGIPHDEPVSSNHIMEEQLKPSALLGAAEEGVFETAIAEEVSDGGDDMTTNAKLEFTDTAFGGDLSLKEETELTEMEQPHGEGDAENAAVEIPPSSEERIWPTVEQEEIQEPLQQLDVAVENNVEAFVRPAEAEDEDAAAESSSGDASQVVDRAREILDEIANFEMETGESVDSPEEEDDASEVQQRAEEGPWPDTSAVPETEDAGQDVFDSEAAIRSRAAAEEELRNQMRMESERRLKAMKIGNEAKSQREPPIKVERPSQRREDSFMTSPPTEDFKGLDYIKSYAKESQESLKSEHMTGESSKETPSPFFTPPPILQDQKKSQVSIRATSSPSRGYSQWTEVDRLKRVREIGTVMWLGRGGNGGSGGSNGGSGGGGNGGRGSGDSFDDSGWWIQVGVSMLTMTALVFAFLTTVSKQLEKRQNRRKTKLQQGSK